MIIILVERIAKHTYKNELSVLRGEKMKGNIQNLSIAGYNCSLYLPPEYDMSDKRYPVVYINGEDELQGIMEEMEIHFGVECSAFIVLCIMVENWNEDFTPWPAPALSKKSDPFGGCTANYIKSLKDMIKPYMDEHYRTKPEPADTALVGYSLGGLTALYALYTSDEFGRIGSLSGSLWYDGWVEFINSHMPSDSIDRVYLSLGKGEEHNRNQRMARVGDYTRKTAIALKEQLKSKEKIILEWNDGGHFTEVPNRFNKALLWLMK